VVEVLGADGQVKKKDWCLLCGAVARSTRAGGPAGDRAHFDITITSRLPCVRVFANRQRVVSTALRARVAAASARGQWKIGSTARKRNRLGQRT
jgi:hypothetical protein